MVWLVREQHTKRTQLTALNHQSTNSRRRSSGRRHARDRLLTVILAARTHTQISHSVSTFFTSPAAAVVCLSAIYSESLELTSQMQPKCKSRRHKMICISCSAGNYGGISTNVRVHSLNNAFSLESLQQRVRTWEQ